MRQTIATAVIIFCLHQIIQIKSDCGRPGYSRHSVIIDSRHRYAEGKLVRYRCKSPGNSLIYGYQERKCENNKWLDSIPKCAAKIPNSKVKKYIRNEVIVVSTNTATKLVGIRLKISARVDIEIDEVKHLYDYNCTRTMGPTKDSYLQKNFIFTCVSLAVDNNDFKDNNFLIVKFTHSLECPPTCKANVEQFELFRIGRDDCFIPDRPEYGSSRLVRLNDSDYYSTSEVRHAFNCNPDFQMRETRNNEDFCPTGGDWQYPPLPQCIPLSTCKLPDIAENVVIDYTDLFQRNRYVIGGVIKYSCAGTDVLSGSSIQECLQNGTWSGNKPKCIPLIMESSNVSLYIAIGCIVLIPMVIVVAVLLAFVCLKQKKKNRISNVSKESSFKYQNKNRELPKKPSMPFEVADPRYSTLDRNFYDDIEIDPNYDYIQPGNTNNTAPVKYDTPRTPTPNKTVVFF